MDLRAAIEARHSVRKYTDQPIVGTVAEELQAFVDECNAESGLALQLILDESKTGSGILGRIAFKGARNCLALSGPDGDDLDERCGYYGQRVVLRAVQLGLGTCWFGGGRKKALMAAESGQRRVMIVTLGYPADPGKPHRSRPLAELYRVEDTTARAAPDWFMNGVRAAQLAPTARNQQKFCFTLLADPETASAASSSAATVDAAGAVAQVKAETSGGLFAGVNLGIVKYHFEVGAGRDSFAWA